MTETFFFQRRRAEQHATVRYQPGATHDRYSRRRRQPDHGTHLRAGDHSPATSGDAPRYRKLSERDGCTPRSTGSGAFEGRPQRGEVHRQHARRRANDGGRIPFPACRSAHSAVAGTETAQADAPEGVSLFQQQGSSRIERDDRTTDGKRRMTAGSPQPSCASILPGGKGAGIWLRRRDSNSRSRGYEPRGMTSSLLRHKGLETASSCRLLWTRNTSWPIRSIGPVRTEPSHDLVILLRRERLARANAGKETAVSGAMPPNSRLTQFAGRAKRFRKSQQMICKFSFHAPLIVGCFPLCNRKHPIRIWRGKFPIIAA